jgi:putative membrane protein insertion efficiency factor
MTGFETPDGGLQSRGGERLRTAPKNLLLWLLRGYKRALSPMLLPSCRYVPTCSEYAAEAIEKHGAFRGSAMAIWRLLRCHPFVHGGFDPVPNPAESVQDAIDVLPRARASKIAQASSICSHTTH